MMMEDGWWAQSSMRSTRGRSSLDAWRTGCMWALGCLMVSTANWLVQRLSASAHIGTAIHCNTLNETSLSLTCRHTVVSNMMSSRYKQHKTEFEVVPSERPLALPCQVRGCRCPAFQYVPQNGPNHVRCRCKHLPQDHREAMGHLCKKCECENGIH